MWIRTHFGIEMCKHVIAPDKTFVGCAAPFTYIDPKGCVQVGNRVANILIDDRHQRGGNPHPLWKQLFFHQTYEPHLDEEHHITHWDYDHVMAAIGKLLKVNLIGTKGVKQ